MEMENRVTALHWRTSLWKT